MTVRLLENGIIELSGECSLEEAEKLQTMLIAQPSARVDWRACVSLHAAILQVILAARRPLIGPPKSAFLRLLMRHHSHPRTDAPEA